MTTYRNAIASGETGENNDDDMLTRDGSYAIVSGTCFNCHLELNVFNTIMLPPVNPHTTTTCDLCRW